MNIKVIITTNMMKSVFLIMVLAVLGLSCKDKKDDPKPTPPADTTTTVVKKPIMIIQDLELYNQALDTTKTTGLYNFYNISQQKYSNSKNFPIELAFVHNQPSDNSSRHLLGSAKAALVKAAHQLPSTNNTKTIFYEIDNGASPLIYDTINYSESIAKIFSSKATKAVVSGENDAIQSDGFGWYKDKIIGFELSNGKKGLIKLTSNPTGSKDNQGNIFIGKIQFDIKMEQ